MQVGGRGLRRAVAHPGVVDACITVDAGAGEAQMQRAGHRGLGPAGVGGAVMSGVAPDRAAGGAGVGVGAVAEGGEDDPQGGEAGGWEVDEVVEAGGGPAEGAVAGSEVADHAVGGVDRLVEGDAGEAGEGAPDGGGDDAVGEILGEAFDGGTGDGGLVQGRGVAADDVGDGGAAGGEAVVERQGDGVDVAPEAALGEQGAGEDGLDQQRGDARERECLEGDGDEGDGGEEEDEGEDAVGAGGGAVEVAVELGDEGADPDDGVADQREQGVRVADEGIEGQGGGGEREKHASGRTMISSGSGGVAHGGSLAAGAAFPAAPRPLLDLSTGINPVAYPMPELTAASFARLPEPGDVAALQLVAARAYGVGDGAMVAAAPGTQILIGLLPLLWPQRRVAVLGPTYGEHAACWARNGAGVDEVGDLDQVGGARCVVVCQPNNPDGRVVAADRLLAMADRLAAVGGLLVVDEAFADFEGVSVAGALPHPALIVLRSFGKSYGLAGVRLGFALADPGRAATIRAALGPWAVSGPAMSVGARALGDGEWRAAAAARLAEDAARMDGCLRAAGLSVVGGTRLFRLAACQDADKVFRRLGEAGVLVRRFAERPGWLRFGLPGDEIGWARLAAALGRASGARIV